MNGEITADLVLQCGRCLDGLLERLDESFSVALSIVDEENSLEEELELDEERINSITLIDDEVDLLPILLEHVFMALPTHSLCSENCPGLCPYCGADLNIVSCTCEPRHFNNRFGKLKDLKIYPS